MHKKILIVLSLVVWALPVFAQEVDTAWVRRYNGPVNGDDRACALVVDGSDNIYVTGYSTGNGTGTDYATVKYNSSGNQLWERRHNLLGNGNDYAYATTLDGYGNICVTGVGYNGANHDYNTIKYDPSGNLLWLRGFDAGWTDHARDIAADVSGYVYVTGYSAPSPPEDLDYVTIKYDPTGSVAWSRAFNGPANGDDSASAITIDASGNVFVTGQCKISNAPVTQRGVGTVKYDAGGNFIYAWYIPPPPNTVNNYAFDIVVDTAGYVYVTGRGYGAAGFDCYTAKYDITGNYVWIKTYNGPGNSDDETKALAVDASGNVYVTGYSFGSGTWEDYVTIKYRSNGDTAWVRRYNGPESNHDCATAMTIDYLGNVYVTGQSYSSVTGWDYATIKYDSSGNQLWVQKYNGPRGINDVALGITVNNSGNVYVTGYSEGEGTDYDYGTIKYWQNYPPNAFSLLSPENDAFIPSGTVAFDWQDATDPDPWDTVKYDLHISTSSTFHPDSTNVYGDLLTSLYSTNLGIGTYYWKVKAHDKRAEVWCNQNWNFVSISTVPVGYWKFNEGSGMVAYDSSGYGNHGTLMNGPAWTSGLPKLGGAIQLDGVDDYVQVADSPSLDINIPAITFMAWIYSPGFHEFGWVIGKGGSGGNIVWHLLARANNFIRYWIRSGGVQTEREIADVLTVNTWQHMAVVYDGAFMRVYRDGIVRDSFPKTGNMDVNNLPLYIGLDGWFTSNHFYGKIDEVKIYSRALSAEEIQAEFEAGFTRGDANGSGLIELGDVVYLISYLYKNGPVPDPLISGDANCSGEVELGDVVYLITYLYKGGPPPPC